MQVGALGHTKPGQVMNLDGFHWIRTGFVTRTFFSPAAPLGGANDYQIPDAKAVRSRRRGF